MLCVSLLLHWLRQFPFKYVIVWFSLVLPDSTRFMPIGTMTFKCLSNSILSSQFSLINQFLPVICKARHFVFPTMVSDVRIFIQLHRPTLECGAASAPIIRTKRKCCKNVEKGQQEECRFMQIKASIQLKFFRWKITST